MFPYKLLQNHERAKFLRTDQTLAPLVDVAIHSFLHGQPITFCSSHNSKLKVKTTFSTMKMRIRSRPSKEMESEKFLIGRLKVLTILCTITLKLGNIHAFSSQRIISGYPTPAPTTFHKRNKGTNTVSTSELWSSSSFNDMDSSLAFDDGEMASSSDCSVKTRFYEHDGYKISYRFKPASKGYELDPPVLLVHPIGIGLSSWFWENFLESWGEGPAVYSPDLLGCGVEYGSDAWDPDTRGMSFPLGWTNCLETFMKTVMADDMSKQRQGITNLFRNVMGTENNSGGIVVVSQGGLAPVGVQLASRNNLSDNVQSGYATSSTFVSKLILFSPPVWNEMTTSIPSDELERNYNFLKSPILGRAAFKVLESRNAVKFFSDLFLFKDKSDDKWLDMACDSNVPLEKKIKARPPVMVFNAGYCNHRSFEYELVENIDQPVLVLSSEYDNRNDGHKEYATKMKNCSIETLGSGKNVLPWESPSESVNAVKSFI